MFLSLVKRTVGLLLTLVKKWLIRKQILKRLQRCLRQEANMDRLGKSLEELIREVSSQAEVQRKPPPDPAEIRRQLEWRLSEERYQEWRLRLL